MGCRSLTLWSIRDNAGPRTEDNDICTNVTTGSLCLSQLDPITKAYQLKDLCNIENPDEDFKELCPMIGPNGDTVLANLM